MFKKKKVFVNRDMGCVVASRSYDDLNLFLWCEVCPFEAESM